MRTTFAFSIAALGSFLFACSGCEAQKAAPKATQTEAAHVHHHGPNGGELYELGEKGKEEYHAELLHDTDSRIVTVFILDNEAKEPVPIAAEAVLFRITFDNQPKEFKLPAKPQAGDPVGNSSKFESNDESFSLALGNERATRELEVKIGDKPYRTDVPYYEPHHVGAPHDEHEGEEKGKEPKTN